MSKRKSQFKPLLFTTTVRNPQRWKDFLSVLNRYDDNILNEDLVTDIIKDVIKEGIYKPTNVSKKIKEKWKNDELLTDNEAEIVIRDNQQDHKEAGFKRGWPSRFDTWYKFTKELGFVYYKMNEKIEFSEAGKVLIDENRPEMEQQIFMNAFVKYQRNNPFRRVLNDNIPLILLLEVIKKLKTDPKTSDAGLTIKEIPLILIWKNNNAEALYRAIKNLRKKYSYTPSDEAILEIVDNINGGERYHSMKDSTILVEYPDDFIRKMKLTGLISIRGAGRFIDINENEINKINYALNKYSEYDTYDKEKEYFNFMGKIDDNLVSFDIQEENIYTDFDKLNEWVNMYSWDQLEYEFKALYHRNKSSNDDVLKYIHKPLRLEFLTTLALLKKYDNVEVIPYFKMDDEGLPISYAPGGYPDIKCIENNNSILVEVTLMKSSQQHRVEVPSISSHLKVEEKDYPNTFCIFIAPDIHEQTYHYLNYIINAVEQPNIIPYSINEFLLKINDNNNLSDYNKDNLNF
jgi:hypothetical protein